MRERALRARAALLRLGWLALLAVSAQCAPGAPGRSPQRWVQIDAGVLSFVGPPDLRAVPVLAADSTLGLYESAQFRITFDHGWDSRQPQPADGSRIERDEIGGLPVLIATYESGPLAGKTSAYFESVTPGSRLRCTFSVAAASPELRPQALQILRSIVFEARPRRSVLGAARRRR